MGLQRRPLFAEGAGCGLRRRCVLEHLRLRDVRHLHAAPARRAGHLRQRARGRRAVACLGAGGHVAAGAPRGRRQHVPLPRAGLHRQAARRLRLVALRDHSHNARPLPAGYLHLSRLDTAGRSCLHRPPLHPRHEPLFRAQHQPLVRRPHRTLQPRAAPLRGPLAPLHPRLPPRPSRFRGARPASSAALPRRTGHRPRALPPPLCAHLPGLDPAVHLHRRRRGLHQYRPASVQHGGPGARGQRPGGIGGVQCRSGQSVGSVRCRRGPAPGMDRARGLRRGREAGRGDAGLGGRRARVRGAGRGAGEDVGDRDRVGRAEELRGGGGDAGDRRVDAAEVGGGGADRRELLPRCRVTYCDVRLRPGMKRCCL
ncbi:hypothetical protein DFJ74DRAFT_756733, partial [Hyaloraphidium curvatum]